MSAYKLPKAYDRYGASMGRSSFDGTYGRREDVRGPMSVARVSLDTGGYDNGGAYWGHGEPLWRAYADVYSADYVEMFFRAPDRAAAIRYVRGLGFVNARIRGAGVRL